ncbi:MAG: hypothetical protein QG670_1743 [Thermoproteota archaeon]|nr:hypothetical protein [Thermoproteota archaeon]
MTEVHRDYMNDKFQNNKSDKTTSKTARIVLNPHNVVNVHNIIYTLIQLINNGKLRDTTQKAKGEINGEGSGVPTQHS